MKGCVYVFSNPHMPGLLKIGRSVEDAEVRADQLFNTSVPTPFYVEFQLQTEDCVALEKLVHDDLVGFRLCSSREFFECPIDVAIEAVNKLSLKITNEYVIERLREQIEQKDAEIAALKNSGINRNPHEGFRTTPKPECRSYSKYLIESLDNIGIRENARAITLQRITGSSKQATYNWLNGQSVPCTDTALVIDRWIHEELTA